ncbi:TetR/AcrR family transcriptional regulator [Sanguibacter antarcticus]|uniref:TetR family transcriptional regulator n=1 Tax=Sanguibacter antarcticus TaxID=372484 RepID=A0A2A9E1L8_9MICO|nr:TetR/AcrR family transcriptional regulator [Sanguibacter antarcticus]PFG32744.1 TetR family transcriptional regulator [Sanguibacter antarcticus]
MNTHVPGVDALTPSARRILDAASTLFYERGVTAVGVDLIAERSGVTKRTLYNRFGSKEVLVTAYLVDRDRRWRLLVEGAVGVPALSPVERVTAPFDALRDWVEHNHRGCAFINALAELPDPAHPAHQVAANEKRWLVALFERLATEAGIEAPGELAHRLLCLHDGALSVQAALPEVDSVGVATRAARELVRAASDDTGPHPHDLRPM